MKKRSLKLVECLFVFCEGSHDVIFLRNILPLIFCLDKVKITTTNREWMIKEYPSPLNSLFGQFMKNREKGDLSLDMAQKFFLPDYTLVDNSNDVKQVVLLFQIKGKNNINLVKDFISLYLPLYNEPGLPGYNDNENTLYKVDKNKFLFLYDSDDQKPEEIHWQLYNDFDDFAIEEKSFLQEPLKVWKDIPQAVISSCKSIGCFVFTDESGKKGTLEDWIYPLFQKDNERLITKAADYVDNTFTWNESIKAQASRKKAIICCAGQKKKPGLSYTIILKEGELVKKQTYKDASPIKILCDYLESFAGLQRKKEDTSNRL